MRDVIGRRLFLIFAVLALAFSTDGSQLSTKESPSPAIPEAQIREVTTRLLRSADKADCKPRNCKILVTNIPLASGLISELGDQLADQISAELARQQTGIQVIDRSLFAAFLDTERISSELLANPGVLRRLGKQLKATAVLTGTIESTGSDVRVLINLISCNKDSARLTESFTLPLPDSKNALSGSDQITKLAPADKWSSAPAAYPAGGGVSIPRCSYCPPPDYPDAARTAKFEGAVVLDIVVSADGKIIWTRIVRGAPYGLNKEAVKAVREWKFKPGTRDGQPVAVVLPLEVTFRFF